MSYLNQFDKDYCSEDDSDYQPSEHSSGSDLSDSCVDSDNETNLSTSSVCGDDEYITESKEVSIKTLGIPTHIRIKKGQQWLINSKKYPLTSVEPKTVQPKTVQPKSVELKTVEPKSVQPNNVEPKTIQPKTVDPKSVQPKTVEPKTVQPKTVELKTVQHKTVEPIIRTSSRQKTKINRYIA